jgi:hypothetical protein
MTSLLAEKLRVETKLECTKYTWAKDDDHGHLQCFWAKTWHTQYGLLSTLCAQACSVWIYLHLQFNINTHYWLEIYRAMMVDFAIGWGKRELGILELLPTSLSFIFWKDYC